MHNATVLDELLRVTDALASDMSGFLTGHGLNTTKAHVLWSLRASGPQMQRWLSEELGYSPRHVTTLIDDLIGLGYVERGPHPDDRRAVLVTLTATGKELMEGFEADRLTLADQLFDHLGTDAKTQLVAVFADLADRLASAAKIAATQAEGTAP